MCVLPCFVLPRNIAAVTFAIQVQSPFEAKGASWRLMLMAAPEGWGPEVCPTVWHWAARFIGCCGSIFSGSNVFMDRSVRKGPTFAFLPFRLQDCHPQHKDIPEWFICQAPMHDRHVNSDIFTLDFTQVECSHHDLEIFRCWQADSFTTPYYEMKYKS